jgi:hypothetical protein
LNQSVEETWQKNFILVEFFWGRTRKTGTFDIILFFLKKIFLNKWKNFTTEKKEKKKKMWLGPWLKSQNPFKFYYKIITHAQNQDL